MNFMYENFRNQSQNVKKKEVDLFTVSEELIKTKTELVPIAAPQKNKPKTDHQSMALTVTEERLASITGKNSLKIEEIKNEDGAISGTKIAFNIQLETDY